MHDINAGVLDRKDTLLELLDAWEQFFRYIAKFSLWRVTLHGLKFGSPSPIRLVELEQEVHNRRAFLAELYCEAYNQTLTILYLLPVHPLTY